MNLELLIHYSFLGILVFFLTLFVIKNRRKVSVEKIFWYFLYVVMYRTKKGLKEMDKLATKHKKFFDVLAKIGVVVGFMGMGFVSFFLIRSFMRLFIAPSALPSFSLVMPFPAKGVVFVPPIFWVISILILAVFHEGAHGIVARKNKIRLKSTGFAILGIGVPLLPAAFVEPDERNLSKKKKWKQIEVFAAGPFANVLLFFIFLGLFILARNFFLGSGSVYYDPLRNEIFEFNGVKFVGYYMKNISPVYLNKVPLNTTFTRVNGKPVFENGKNNFVAFLDSAKPGDIISLETKDGKVYTFPLGRNPKSGNENPRPLLGAQLIFSQEPVSYKGKFTFLRLFLVKLLLGSLAWLYILNLGVGLFNLLPIGPLDGGRMIKALFEALFKRESTATLWWNLVSNSFLLLLIILILYPFFV